MYRHAVLTSWKLASSRWQTLSAFIPSTDTTDAPVVYHQLKYSHAC